MLALEIQNSDCIDNLRLGSKMSLISRIGKLPSKENSLELDIADSNDLILGFALEELKWRKILDDGVAPEKWLIGYEAFRQLFQESLVLSPFRSNEKFLLFGLEVDIVENDPWLIRLFP
jgi:hypothetical protein